MNVCCPAYAPDRFRPVANISCLSEDRPMDDFVALTSRKKIALIILGCVGFVGLGLWLAGVVAPPPASSRYSSDFILMIGWSSVVFFEFCGILASIRLFNSRERLRIGADGVRSLPWSDQTIPWQEIVDVTTWTFKRQSVIVLHLRDPAQFPGRGLAALVADANRNLTGGDISISLTGTNRTFEETILAVEQFYFRAR